MSDNNNNNAFLILAAGKGTRMKNDLPKVLHKICGKEMVEYTIDLAKSFQTNKIAAITSKDAPQTINFIKDNHPDITLINQDERLGTGHAVKICSDYLDSFKGNIICLYGDTPFISKNSISELVSELDNKDKTSVAVLGFEAKDPAKYGRLKLDENQNLTEIVEFNDASDEEKKITLCNSGVMAIKGKYFKDLIEQVNNNNSKQEYYLTDLVEISASNGYLCRAVLAEENDVMGINSQKERAIAENVMQDRLRKKHMANGVTLISPETVFFSLRTQIESGVTIEPNVQFYGEVTIKRGSIIKGFSYLENCEIGENNIIGPYARIRPETKLSDNVKVGNFVEIKKSKIKKGSKINHLSYIGDSLIGQNVNVGAGVITCNYDGKSKFKTSIGDSSFIGSNSSLIAPINIGNNSVVGAGTTVLKDVADEEICINKKTQDKLSK